MMSRQSLALSHVLARSLLVRTSPVSCRSSFHSSHSAPYSRLGSSFHSSPIPIPFPTSRRLRRALRAEARRGGMGGDGEVTRNEVRSRVKEITVHRKFPRLALYVHLPHSHHSPRAAARFAGETGSGGRRMK